MQSHHPSSWLPQIDRERQADAGRYHRRVFCKATRHQGIIQCAFIIRAWHLSSTMAQWLNFSRSGAFAEASRVLVTPSGHAAQWFRSVCFYFYPHVSRENRRMLSFTFIHSHSRTRFPAQTAPAAEGCCRGRQRFQSESTKTVTILCRL